MGKKIVVALGGNAILTDDVSATVQQKALLETAQYLAEFIIQGNQLIVSHGNGPQVGNLLLQMAGGSTDKNPVMPLDTDVAMTQGSIGYWLQNALGRVLREKCIDRDVATVVTQVLVDANDQAFSNPSKPVGPFYDEAGMKKPKLLIQILLLLKMQVADIVEWFRHQNLLMFRSIEQSIPW